MEEKSAPRTVARHTEIVVEQTTCTVEIHGTVRLLPGEACPVCGQTYQPGSQSAPHSGRKVKLQGGTAAMLPAVVLASLFTLVAATPFVTGCGGSFPATIPISGPVTPVAPPAPTINAAVTAKNLYSVNTANQSVDVYAANLDGTATSQSSYPGGALSVTGDGAGNLYTATYSATEAAVQVYPAGSTAVSRSITVATAAANAPQISTIAVDAEGYLYVAISNSILVYGPTASGAAKPVRTLAGALTTLSPQATQMSPEVTQMAFDSGNNLYVATGNGYKVSQVIEFPAGADGNVAPVAITSADYAPTGVTLDALGNIYIVQGNPFNPSQGTYTAAINVFPKGSVAGDKPSRTISGATGVELSTGQIFVDSGGNIFISTVLDGQTDFLVFSATATGSASPASKLVRSKGSSNPADSQFYLR